jgi:hypothetical protein
MRDTGNGVYNNCGCWAVLRCVNNDKTKKRWRTYSHQQVCSLVVETSHRQTHSSSIRLTSAIAMPVVGVAVALSVSD